MVTEELYSALINLLLIEIDVYFICLVAMGMVAVFRINAVNEEGSQCEGQQFANAVHIGHCLFDNCLLLILHIGHNEGKIEIPILPPPSHTLDCLAWNIVHHSHQR